MTEINLRRMQLRHGIVGTAKKLPEDDGRKARLLDLADKILRLVQAEGGLSLEESYAVSLGARGVKLKESSEA